MVDLIAYIYIELREIVARSYRTRVYSSFDQLRPQLTSLHYSVTRQKEHCGVVIIFLVSLWV